MSAGTAGTFCERLPVRSITTCTKDYGFIAMSGGDVYHVICEGWFWGRRSIGRMSYAFQSLKCRIKPSHRQETEFKREARHIQSSLFSSKLGASAAVDGKEQGMSISTAA